MHESSIILNNRELAALIWGALLLLVSLTQSKVRSSAVRVVKAFFAPKLLIVVFLMLLWISASVLFLFSVGLWAASLLKDTALWTLGVAVALLFSISKAQAEKSFFLQAVLANVKFAVFLEFMVNLYAFPFWIEFALFPAVLFVGIMQVAAESDTRYSSVKSVLEWLLIAYGLLILGFSIFSLVREHSTLLTFANASNFLLPLLLTVAIVPYIYLFALFAQYESIFLRLRFLNPNQDIVRIARRTLLRKFNLNLRALSRWSRSGRITRIVTISAKHEMPRLFEAESGSDAA